MFGKTKKEDKQKTETLVKTAPLDNLVLDTHHPYRSNGWWLDHVKQGDSVSLEWDDLICDHHEATMFFDTTRTWEDGLQPSFMLIFQKKKEDMGRKDICIPVIPTNIKRLISINENPFEPGKHFKVKEEKPKTEEPEPEKLKLTVSEDKKIQSEPEEKIVNKPEPEPVKRDNKKQRYRIICTCGKEYGDGAWYKHRNKEGKEEHKIKDRYIGNGNSE